MHLLENELVLSLLNLALCWWVVCRDKVLY
jgi:hypothetical protein